MTLKYTASLLISFMGLAVTSIATTAIAQTPNATTIATNNVAQEQSVVSSAPVPASGKSIDVSSLIEKGQIAQALTQLDAYLQTNPKDILALYQKAVALPLIGRSDEAIAIFSDITQTQPKLAEPYNNLGVLLSMKGDLPRAKASLEKAIETKEDYAAAYNNLGDVYVKIANNLYQKSLSLDAGQKAIPGKINTILPIVNPNMASQLVKVSAAKTDNTMTDAKPEANITNAEKTSNTEAKTSNQEITAMLKQWLTAWSKQDVDSYLNFYTSNYAGSNHQAWQNERRAKISAKKSIDVGIKNVKISAKNDKAIVKFTQHYTSNQFKEVSYKVLTLVKVGNSWKISQER